MKKTRAVILAGGEGTRLGVLTSKRTKPAVPFGGKYRIIDFVLSNCVNSNLFDVMIIAQYRPHSLIEHIGAGGPWDLARDFTGGVRIYTPYKARASGWFSGTADAVQQNFGFIKHDQPERLLILSGDHIYNMDYSAMIQFHQDNEADVTLATIEVPIEEASRFGIVGVNSDNRVTSFIEKPKEPPSNLVNMGVYIFNTPLLDGLLWEDHLNQNSSHDFGKDILPKMVANNMRVFAFPYSGYWVDVGTVSSYWQAHMDLLLDKPPLNLYDRSWVVHTRSEERPPAKIFNGAIIENSLISDGCIVEAGAHVSHSVLSPGVHVQAGAHVLESIILTDCVLESNVTVERTVMDKRAQIKQDAKIGGVLEEQLLIAMIGKNSIIPENLVVLPGATIGPDVIPSDFPRTEVQSGEIIQTRRLPYEV
jgi:glucose-1-phosphate adenylyltransferase